MLHPEKRRSIREIIGTTDAFFEVAHQRQHPGNSGRLSLTRKWLQEKFYHPHGLSVPIMKRCNDSVVVARFRKISLILGEDFLLGVLGRGPNVPGRPGRQDMQLRASRRLAVEANIQQPRLSVNEIANQQLSERLEWLVLDDRVRERSLGV